jgi:hypothetical protein
MRYTSVTVDFLVSGMLQRSNPPFRCRSFPVKHWIKQRKKARRFASIVGIAALRFSHFIITVGNRPPDRQPAAPYSGESSVLRIEKAPRLFFAESATGRFVFDPRAVRRSPVISTGITLRKGAPPSDHRPLACPDEEGRRLTDAREKPESIHLPARPEASGRSCEAGSKCERSNFLSFAHEPPKATQVVELPYR